jgi:ATP-dependent exoDNAse (exonuclease V) beta subunit
VLRNLARELELTANLRIGLNDTQVEEQAVDMLIDSLTHHDIMLQWLLKYIMETISDDRSWNIIGQVKQFGRTIFRDYYKEHSVRLNELMGQKGFLEGYMEQLRQIRSNAANQMKDLADEFFQILDNEHVSIDELSYGKTGVYSFFVKLQNGQMDESIVGNRVLGYLDAPSKWYTKKAQRAEFIHMLADSTLMPLLKRTLDARPQQWRLYQSADLTLRHLNQLRLLGSIELKVRQLNEESNRFLLSDTQQLLHALISDSDSPFIFEKIGSQLEHVMIDEFQDTSTVQWQNFKLLLQECMSHESTENLIVGDVKQSIYRWRSGDWRLLNAIDREFLHADEMVDIKPLETNYRSSRNIIEFNNAFFQEAARQEYERLSDENPEGARQLEHAYADVAQKVPDHRQPVGLVSIRLLPATDYQEHTMNLLTDTVQELRQQGVAPSDIAILVRTNKYIPLIADYFAAALPDVRIVSDEAFRLDASISVCLLVQALHLLTHPDDLLAKAMVAKLYHRAVLGEDTPEQELLIQDRPLDNLLPEAFTLHTAELLQMPLYELVERLFGIFQLHRLNEQSAYMCAFYDQLNKFTQDNATDIDTFVREWDETISSKTIQSDVSDGVRILSIHKSKGLEFGHVLIPFCDWRLEMPDLLWCEPPVEPFNALPIAPIDYSEKQMRGTIYEPYYLDEHLQNTVDNLNLLYVAFTRAVDSLYVIGQRGSKSNRSALLESVLPHLQLDGATLSGEDDEQAPIAFDFGQLPPLSSQFSPLTSQNAFLQPVTPLPITMESFDVKTEFRQSNRSRDFIEGDDEQQELSYIKVGSVLHEIFSTIRTSADIPRALQQLQTDGVLYDDEVTREKLTLMLKKRLEDKRVRNWFSDGWQLFNECSILRLDEHGELVERRPDRVITNGTETHIIDFKFGRPHAEYHDQVSEYMQLLRSMGMPGVKGWLWYVYSNRIEEV